jgi:hypothetical protein
MMLRTGNTGPLNTGFSWLLSAFVRGRVHVQFETAEPDYRSSREVRDERAGRQIMT